MTSVRFIHCADLHIDTPFRGLSQVAKDIAKTLGEATFTSFENIIDLAVANHVDFVVIAGDVYDSSDRSLRAQFAFRDGLGRLAEHGIPSFVAFGNHDPVSGWSNSLEWPELAHRFGAKEVDVCQVTRGGTIVASVHGMSFGKATVTDDLSSQFEPHRSGVPEIAVLHANVGSNTGHAPYAPTTVPLLAKRGFDYWALGHVHRHQVLRTEAPAIVYPGCSQSRHPNETGAKGCCLVTLSDSGAPDVRFVPTDVVRYRQERVDVSSCATIDAIQRIVEEACDRLSEEADGRHLVMRLALAGRTPLQRELLQGDTHVGLEERLREGLLGRSPWVWLERLTLETRGAYDIQALRAQQDFTGDMVRAYTSLLDSDSDALPQLRAEIETDLRTWAGYRHLTQPSDDEIRYLAERAMHETLNLTAGED